MTDHNALEERIREVLKDLGCGDVKIHVSDFFPGIAAVPLINTIMVSRRIAEHLTDEDLKAILAHEVYHLSVRKDRRRLLRNVLLSTAAYLILIDIFLLLSLPYFILIEIALPDSLPLLMNAVAITASIAFFAGILLISIRISRRFLSKLMRYVPFGIEELEANSYAIRGCGIF